MLTPQVAMLKSCGTFVSRIFHAIFQLSDHLKIVALLFEVLG